MEQQQPKLQEYFILGNPYCFHLELVDSIEKERLIEESDIEIETTIMAVDFEDAHRQLINYIEGIN